MPKSLLIYHIFYMLDFKHYHGYNNRYFMTLWVLIMNDKNTL